MKRHFHRTLYFILFWSYGSAIVAQSGVELKPTKIKNQFIQAFNSGSITTFYRVFDGKMQERRPIEELEQKLSQLRAQAGPITEMALVESDNNSYIYRCRFEKIITAKVKFKLNDKGMLSEMLITNYTYKDGPELLRNSTSFTLPFHGEWYVFWGGKNVSDNYHNAHESMKGAYDFLVMDVNGKSHNGNPRTNEDFYAFGKEMLAPADAKVIYTFDQVPDNDWPAMNRSAGGGNMVLLETINREYILLAHLKQHSIKVEVGQQVKQGQVLGLCGNSGNSTEPHLHFQLQNLPDLAAARGAWSHFKEIKVHGKTKKDYIPTKGDRISN